MLTRPFLGRKQLVSRKYGFENESLFFEILGRTLLAVNDCDYALNCGPLSADRMHCLYDRAAGGSHVIKQNHIHATSKIALNFLISAMPLPFLSDDKATERSFRPASDTAGGDYRNSPELYSANRVHIMIVSDHFADDFGDDG